MRNVLRNAVFSVLVLLVCILSLYPPKEKLRLGRDLAGGATLTYEVNVAQNEDAAQVMDSVINVLKRRVDPDGVMSISFVRQGRNRLEISMPLPTREVQELKANLRRVIEEVGAQAIDPGEFDRAMRAPADERSALITRWADGNERRLATLTDAAQKFDAAQAARRAYDEAVAAGAPDDQQQTFLAAAGDAVVAFESARSAALAMSVSSAELDTMLALSSAERRIKDEVSKQMESVRSPRALAIEKLKASHPEAAADIDRVLAAHEAYEARRRGLDDPADLKRLLSGAGVLNFRIAYLYGEHPLEERLRSDLVEKGPRAASTSDARWFPLHSLEGWYDSKQDFDRMLANPRAYFENRGRFVVEARDGVFYMLLHDDPGMKMTQADGEWKVSSARPDRDNLGRPAIAFTMDPRGAQLLGALTGPNVNKPMAVMLDDKVYTAPNLNSAISASGQIMGVFSPAEISYIVRTLGAGSLQAKLSEQPIGESVVGPELGADNLRLGLIAGVGSFVSVAIFMIAYYYTTGVVAVFALFCNAIFILGLMSLSRAAFTLPGIAGIVLTFGAAVDSNVLIYERLREELSRGANLRNSIRLAFDRATRTILDSNVTNLIVCVVLGYFGTPEIRGFAVTLGIGVVGTIFTAVVVTRLILELLIGPFGCTKLSQLPVTFPGLQRALTPTLNWLRLTPAWFAGSALAIALGLYAVSRDGRDLLDNEFRGGVIATVQLASVDPDGDGPLPAAPRTATRREIQDRLFAEVADAQPGTPEFDLKSAEVIPVNPEADGVTSSHFQIKTVALDQQLVSTTIGRALSDIIAFQSPIRFAGVDGAAIQGAPAFRILDARLGQNINRPEVTDDVSRYVGGAAFVLDDIEEPLPTRAGIVERLRSASARPEHASLASHTRDVIVLEAAPDGGVRSAVIVAASEITVLDDESSWSEQLAGPEWALVRAAALSSSNLAGLQAFSPAIAQTFLSQAIIAILFSLLGILVYVWLRFNSARYAIAAILSLAHDAVVMVGMIWLADFLYKQATGVANALMIVPFKIDLEIIAALLAVICYSLNDKIVLLDRARELRGKLDFTSPGVVNDAINQTFSRTIILAGTTVFAVLVLYVFGGDALRGFSYVILVGTFVGTYSTIAICAPLIVSRRIPASHRPEGLSTLASGRAPG